MSDTKALARVAVLQAAILNVLRDADADTRAELRTLLEPGDAASVRVDGSDLGRVRRDKPSQRWQVVDFAAFQRWCEEFVPSAVVTVRQVSPAFQSSLLKAGHIIDPVTGEVIVPDGIGLVESEGRLVVTTTDEATVWAQRTLAGPLRELE